MAIRNAERVFVEAVRRFAAERGLALETLSHDWILVLGEGSERRVVFAYDIGLNGSNVVRIANDKAAAYEVLSGAGVPAIEHRLFLEPDLQLYIDGGGNWAALGAAFDDFAGDVVVKANEGTSGKDVHRVRDRAELERVVHRLFQSCRSIAVAPFVPIRREQRFVVLDGAVALAYEKSQPALEGDGRTPLRELLARAMTPESGPSLGDYLATLATGELERVPAAGEPIAVGWRHNLGQGGTLAELDPGSPAGRDGAALALDAAAAVGLRFGSVDIAVGPDGRGQVLEINAGVMLEHYARSGAAARARTLDLYHAALARLYA